MQLYDNSNYYYYIVSTKNGPLSMFNKSSAVAEMGHRDHNRHGPKRGGGCCVLFAESWDPI